MYCSVGIGLEVVIVAKKARTSRVAGSVLFRSVVWWDRCN